ncbi:MAG: 50S ribosomal protein L4 [Candidatus Andersenbacteria bacterium]
MASKSTKKTADKNAADKLPVHTLGQKKEGSADVPAFMQTVVSPEAIAQVMHVARRRSRVRRAHTKERAEVRGGGRKPWKQKGTGRSRHGSSRSPLWVGGGTTFGPRAHKERVPVTPVKERGRALAGAFALHVQQGTMALLKVSKLPEKTKDFVAQAEYPSGLLIVVDETHKALSRVARNVTGVRVMNANIVIVRDLVEANQVWVDEDALPALQARTKFHVVSAE